MGAIELTRDTFISALQKGGILVIDWWADWCGPCRVFGPILDEAAARHPDAVFAKINVDQERELAGELGVMALPTLMVIRDSVLVFAQAGAIPGAAVDALLEEVRALDMDKLHEQPKEAKEAAHG